MRSSLPLRAALRRPPRGAAILLAMVILTIVATIASGMVWQQNRAVQVEAAERARAQSAWILAGALDWARLILREDDRVNQQRQRTGQLPYDGLDEPWATPLAEARLSAFLAADRDNNAEEGGGPEAFLSGSIVDAQANWNLRNLLGPDGKIMPTEMDSLRTLVELAGAPADAAERIAGALRDAWVPGADPGGTRARPISPARFSDLAWLGIEPETLSRLEPWVTLLPVRTPVNVNTAPREAIVAAIDKLDLGTAERLVQQRQRQPFESLEQVRAQLPPNTPLDAARVAVTSRWFVISGRLRLDERVLEERSLVERRDADVVVRRRERINLSEPR
ncbi:MAG: type II secretion system minor pseudopilin GspK [Betaproteobacteria bacterium]|nr:type II secretion system minor pseudopilin GspK [Betaproteobacteria bacterium]MCC6851860.1 type II secretion system minor pseudopilin GspK [Rubrivivax sp.]MCL4695969.1 type II secretion system minor pseudopilin GspK [Burkholderiaceae bacterium]